MLSSLPKTLRRLLQPFGPKVEDIVRELQPEGPTLMHDLSRFLQARYAVQVPVSEWRPQNLPAWFRGSHGGGIGRRWPPGGTWRSCRRPWRR